MGPTRVIDSGAAGPTRRRRGRRAGPRGRLLAGLVPVALGLTGCGLIGSDAPPVTEDITVTSPAFREGGAIPSRFTCRGERMSPPLRWSGVPRPQARSLALVVDDPDAPAGTYVHWIVYDIDPLTTEVQEGMVPRGARQARGSGGRVGYDPPCPPSGTHTYRFTVYALRGRLGLAPGGDLRTALAEISGRVLARGRITGAFPA